MGVKGVFQGGRGNRPSLGEGGINRKGGGVRFEEGNLIIVQQIPNTVKKQKKKINNHTEEEERGFFKKERERGVGGSGGRDLLSN